LQNKSPGGAIRFEDLQLEMIGYVLRVPNAAHQRWSSLGKVLERVLSQWEVLRQHYFNENKPFPLADLK
jgi:hypothetical protein